MKLRTRIWQNALFAVTFVAVYVVAVPVFRLLFGTA